MVISAKYAPMWRMVCTVNVVIAVACARPPAESGEDRHREGTVASFDGVPIAYEVHGTGSPALVLVHGWSCDRTYWQSQAGPLSADFQVVTVDLAGHGASGLGREQWTIESFGADVAAVADELGLQRMVLVGHSMGGDVVLEAARRLTGRVAGLVWVDTYKSLASPRAPGQIAELVAPFRADFVGTTTSFARSMFPRDADPALVERVANDMASAPPQVAVPAMTASLSYGRGVTVPLQELDLPLVAINPEDPPTDLASMEQYGVDVVLMPGVGHFLMMEDPEGFNALLREIVNRWSR